MNQRKFLLKLILLHFFCATVLIPARAQLGDYSREDLIKYTRLNPYDRFPDGRPKVPDELLEKLKSVSLEDAWGVLRDERYTNQWEGSWQVIHPEVKLVGRVMTAQFMPLRPDLNELIEQKAKDKGLAKFHNLRVIDRLQENDVVVVDLFGKIQERIFVGGNLATAVYARSKTGMVIDGAIRDLDEVFLIPNFVSYVRGTHPSPIGNVMLMGINVPVRIGEVTVLPGDVVLGDRAGVLFIPPHLVAKVIEASQSIRLKDEFTKMKMQEGKYLPSKIYPEMSPEVKREYEAWLKERKSKP